MQSTVQRTDTSAWFFADRTPRRASYRSAKAITASVSASAIAAVMELVNHIARADDTSEAARPVRQEGLETAVLLLAPIVPHVASVLWQALGHTDDIIEAAWPRPDEDAMVRDEIEIVLQVNGKKRAIIQVPADSGEASCEAAAIADDNVKRFTA